MVDTLRILIDKQDNFEVVGDQIALILKTEFINQQALALAGGKDPTLWDIRVFLERSEPWETFLDDEGAKTPLVNIWFDTENFAMGKGNTVSQQMADGVFNLDVYGYGITSATAGGQNPGDKEAVFEARRGMRLVRNIIMSSLNTYLQLRGTVARRWPNTIVSFQPEFDGVAVQNIMASRLALNVLYVEQAPQETGEPLEFVSVDIKRTEDGQIVLEADYDYT